MSVIVDQVLLSRTDGVEALVAPLSPQAAAKLRDAARRARETATALGRTAAAADWLAFGAALEITAYLADWREGAYTAQPDAERHLRAARLQLDVLASGPNSGPFAAGLLERLDVIRDSFEVTQVGELLKRLSTLAMPIGFIAAPIPEPPDWSRASQHADRRVPEEQISVAFLEFKIDGVGANTVHALRPHQVCDLALTVRISRWPEGAAALLIRPMSLEPPSVWDLPTFEILAPTSGPPHVIDRRGRMVLLAGQGINARPLEFIYTAEFQPPGVDQAVLAGQRTLRLDGVDPSQQPVTGWRDLDAKILKIREELRLRPLVVEEDLRDLLTLLVPVGGLMGEAATDARYAGPIDEAAFQVDFRRVLRQRPAIGSALQDQANVAGGRVDLSFRNIAIELKSEQKARLLPADCADFAKQAASYAVGRGSRLALLCVLDCSPKNQIAFPVDDGLFLQVVETGASQIYVVTCLLQGGLAKPSSFSR